MLLEFPALDANWRETLRSQKRAVVFCWAAWSPPDKMFAPVLANVVPHYGEQFQFFTADIDAKALVPFFTELGVMTTPQLVWLRQGTKMASSIGFMQQDALRAQFNTWLNK